MNGKPSNALKIANQVKQISDQFLEDIDIHLISVFLKWGENFTSEGLQILSKLKNLKNLEIDFDYIVFDIAFMWCDHKIDIRLS
jgi:hypothetical protein